MIRELKLWSSLLLAFLPPLGAADLSSVVLPVRIPLDGFVREAETWIPMRYQSEWQTLQKTAFGQNLKAPLATRFSTRRLPIEWRTMGDRIEMRVPILYRVELGVPRVERKSAASLGVGWRMVSHCEPAAGAVLRIETRLELRPTWAVKAHSRPVLDLPAPCRLNALGENLTLDITSEVRQVFTASLDRAAAELDRQIEVRADLRRVANTLWARLHEPIALGEQMWLQLNPRSVSIDQPRLEDGEVRTGLRLTGQPRITGAREALTVIGPLPSLATSDGSTAPDFQLDLDLDVSWPELNARLRDAMTGKVFKTAGNRRLHITAISAAPNGDRLVLEAEVEGSFKGHIGLSGRPVIKDGTLSFDDLRYTLATDSMLIRFANWLRQDLYRRQFAALAQVNLLDFLTTNRQRIEDSMRTGWTGEIKLDGQIERLESGAVDLTPESLRLRAHATGKVIVLVGR